MGMHGHVPENVMKNVGFWDVFERIAAAQPRRGRKLSRREHFKEGLSGKEAANRCSAPSGPRSKYRADRREIGKQVFLKANNLVALEIFLARVSLNLRRSAAHQFLPYLVLFRRVFGIFLLDQIGRRGLELFRWHLCSPAYRMNLCAGAGKVRTYFRCLRVTVASIQTLSNTALNSGRRGCEIRGRSPEIFTPGAGRRNAQAGRP